MEPSFWSWEKAPFHLAALTQHPYRNGAQLLELGKGTPPARRSAESHEPQWSPAFGAGKSGKGGVERLVPVSPQWSPAFGAGKRTRLGLRVRPGSATAMEPSFWSWEKSSRFFHQLTTSVAHLCEQRKFWGRRVGLLLPDRLGKLALTRARALPRGTEGAGALARRSAGLGWVAPRGLQRI